MQLHDTALPQVKRITLTRRDDARGFFIERYRADSFAALGVNVPFVQTNHSRSAPGVIRGLHFQHAPMQGKLVGVTRGAVLDVAVDVRPHSPHFGKHVAVELSDTNATLLWIPPGFAHGFCVLGDEAADVVYQMSAPYAAMGEGGIRFDDPALAIAWPLAREQAIVSPRDMGQPTLAEAKHTLSQWFKDA